MAPRQKNPARPRNKKTAHFSNSATAAMDGPPTTKAHPSQTTTLPLHQQLTSHLINYNAHGAEVQALLPPPYQDNYAFSSQAQPPLAHPYYTGYDYDVYNRQAQPHPNEYSSFNPQAQPHHNEYNSFSPQTQPRLGDPYDSGYKTYAAPLQRDLPQPVPTDLPPFNPQAQHLLAQPCLPKYTAYGPPPQHLLAYAQQPNPAVTNPYDQMQHHAGDPFWYQFTPLHFPPDTAVNYEMDTHTAAIGHGMKQHVGKKAPKNQVSEPRKHEMVDVYNNKTFVAAVPLKLLLRFSATALDKFPKPIKLSAGVGAGPSMGSSNASGSQAVFGDSGSSRAASPSSQATDVTTESIRTPGRKCLTLILDGAENPTNDSVKWTLKWMEDNAQADKDLLPYAPNLRKLDFENLVDFYQASLVLGLKPAPIHILDEIMKRLSDRPPTPAMMGAVASYIPIGNAVIERAITSYHHYRSAGRYDKRNLDGIEMVMNAQGNELFLERRTKIFAIIAKKQAKEYTKYKKMVGGEGVRA